LQTTKSSDIGLWFLGSLSGLLGLRIAIILASCHFLGILHLLTIEVHKFASHVLSLLPKFFKNAGKMPPVPAAFQFLF
jgi:hypothetical protein